ncbi:hypothetical protein N431DRAFT_525782 [Stipitochalara longipes BDJ]|nr:hypothetical protein N431DRAFT_525782 [Stipitochalara longipes BDJ]
MAVNTTNTAIMQVFNVLAILLTLPTLWSFIKSRLSKRGSFAHASIIVINDYLNLCYFVNSILWSTDDISTAFSGVGLCDVQAAFKWPMSTALALSLCVVMVRLWIGIQFRKPREFFSPAAENAYLRKQLYIDAFCCWGYPAVQLGLLYLIRDQRYNLSPVLGCSDSIQYNWLAVLLYLWLGPATLLVTMVFAVLTLHQLRKNWAMIKILRRTRSGDRAKQFLKLATISLLALIPFTVGQIFFISNAFQGSIGGLDWSAIHYPGWSSTWTLSTLAETGNLTQYVGWSSAIWNLMIFVVYGFTKEANDAGNEMACGFMKVVSYVGKQIQKTDAKIITWLRKLASIISNAFARFAAFIAKQARNTTSKAVNWAPESALFLANCIDVFIDWIRDSAAYISSSISVFATKVQQSSTPVTKFITQLFAWVLALRAGGRIVDEEEVPDNASQTTMESYQLSDLPASNNSPLAPYSWVNGNFIVPRTQSNIGENPFV